jgi:4-methyl-5(b-hydroxyethyl)-thiazole monophosphate biosynthesis
MLPAGGKITRRFCENVREKTPFDPHNSHMSAPTALVFLAEGFEEIEVVTPLDILRRAGIEVTTASIGAGIHVTGRCGLTVHADTTLSALGGQDFDCLLIPGGPAVKLLKEDARVVDLLRRQDKRNGWIAAICAAPAVLNVARLLGGRRYTAHFSVASELPAAIQDERSVVDGRLITSRGAGTALEFGLLVVEKLISPEKAAEVARAICA